jgi:hypothetical protein
MGMFTSISDPKLPRICVQIKCGIDYCDFLSVGDTIPSHLTYPDGKYLGWGHGHGPNADLKFWVVIKDQVIQGCEQLPSNLNNLNKTATNLFV